jgi:hypothetical protein
MSEESPIYGATNHDIIDVCRRITNVGVRLKAVETRLIQMAPLLINMSARLEALEDKLGDTGDSKADRSTRAGSVSQPLNNWENEGGAIK